jgi:hypothetical protein
MKIYSLSLTFLSIMFSPAALGVRVDQEELSAALDQIASAASVEASVSFGVVEVKGSTPKAMLEDYARDNYGEPTILIRMTAAEIPEMDGGVEVLGFVKNVDAVDFAVPSAFNQEVSSSVEAAARRRALSGLFRVTKAGGLVGIESAGWNACGSIFPSLFVLDPDAKKVYTLTPDDTSC